MKRRLALAGVVPLLATSLAVLGQAPAMAAPDDRADRELPAHLTDLRLDSSLERTGIGAAQLDASLVDAQGQGTVIVRLKATAVAERDLTDAASARAKEELQRSQAALMTRIQALDPDARLVAQTQLALNAVFVEVDRAVLPQLANDPAVMRIAPVGAYELDLSETVPYIGATAVQESGITGKGIKVAVLDSGIDYTHVALGGSGDVADFEGNDPTVIEPGTFPTAKVVGGYDFTGSAWPNSPEAPDPDPIDDGPGGGHGTHVADIIAGKDGVAPGADLYSVKVCSSVSTSCSGIALIQGMEFSLDPNGDGRLGDRVHIINMSLGSSYGQPFDDDLSAAVENATTAGVLTVASAGNSADKPYANGTPAAAPSALSVAQTSVPSAALALMQIVAPANIAGQVPAVFQPWSAPLTSAIEAPLQYGNGAGGNLDGCAAFAPGSLAGKIVLVDRGACNFTLKAKNVGDAGGLVAIIGQNAPGDAFEGGDGGDRPIAIPSYLVTQQIANRLRTGLPNTVVRFDPAVGLPLAGTMVGSSSRGPQHEDTALIKPEIGAPGASVSAIAGSGTETGPFGGTSGAAPMVAGAAALVLEASGGVKTSANGTPGGRAAGHGLRPLEVKSLLVNTGYTGVINNALTGELAPITRIGGGEVRVDRAVSAPTAAWASDVASGTLSFGFVDVTDTVTLTRTVSIRNYANAKRTYTVTPTFRFADDQTNGAVEVSAPSTVDVKPGKGRDTTFTVTMTIDGSKLRGNFMNSGSAGADPATLTTNEYDGYLVLDDGTQKIQMPWHVLPRKAAEVVPSTTTVEPGSFPQAIGLDNTGAGTAQNDAYALVATSDDQPEGAWGEQSPTPDIRAVGVNTYPVPAGFCSAGASFVWAFAVNTWERQQHLLPVSHQIYLDTDQNGVDDYVILNRDFSGLSTITDGRQLSWVVNLSTGSATASFFAEHSTNTGNTVLLVCGEQVGMNASDLLANTVDVDVVAQDFYFGGPGDAVRDLVVTPLGERFYGEPSDVAAGATGTLNVFDFGAFPGNTEELGLMLVTNGDRGAGNRGGATQDTEALLFLTP
jgi:subtilisin family serine protease